MTTTTRRSPWVLAATALLSVGLLLGCGAEPAVHHAPAQATAAAEADQKAGKVAVPQATAPASGPAGAPVTENRQLARTASTTVRVSDVRAAAARLRVIAAGQGGIVSAEDVVVAENGYGRPSTLVVVVPADRLDATLEEIGGVGTVVSRTISTTDVTTQVADVEARIRTQRESIARVQDLFQKAGTVAEVAQVESELTRRQAELESLLARQKALSAQVAESPITITLTTPATPQTVEEAPGFLLGLKVGWRAFTSFVAVALMVVGGVLPFAVAFGLLGLVGWKVGAWLVARRRANRPDPVRPTGPVPPAASAAPAAAGPASRPVPTTPPTARPAASTPEPEDPGARPAPAGTDA